MTLILVASSMSTEHVVGGHCNCWTSEYWEQVTEHATISGCVASLKYSCLSIQAMGWDNSSYPLYGNVLNY